MWYSLLMDGMDSALLLENGVIFLLPTIFVFAALVRGYQLLDLERKTKPRSRTIALPHTKIFFICILGIVQIICIFQRYFSEYISSKVLLLASLIAVASTLCLAVLSYLEHDRSISPSSVIVVYLLLSVLSDASSLWTIWLDQKDISVLLTQTSPLFLMSTVFILESKSKRGYLQASYRDSSPEALAGIIERYLFWWLIPTLKQGYHISLELGDLPHLDTDLSVSRNQALFAQTWSTWRTSRGSHPLLFAAFACFRGPLFAILPPRLLTIICKFSQPLLIESAVKLLGSANAVEKKNSGLLLTGAAAIVYIGIAVGTALYKHKIYRAMLAFRSGLIGVIHDSSLSLSSTDAKDVAAVTLMSTDVDRIISGIEMLDVIWATPIEVILAIGMLARQLGWACMSPLLISIGCAIASIFIGKLATKYQRTWISSTQERVTATTHLLNNIKSIKMMGLTETLTKGLQDRRVTEIQQSQSYRKVDTAQQVIGNTTLVITPVTTFLLYYALAQRSSGESLDPAKAFTSLSLITLLSYPILYFVFAIPRFTGSIACYDRIQDYLLGQENDSAASKDEEDFETELGASDNDSDDIELESLLSKGATRRLHRPNWAKEDPASASLAAVHDVGASEIKIENAEFSFAVGAASVLSQISITVRRGEVVLLTGPTGCGKSTLLLAVLGELHQSQGLIRRAPSLGVAFCAQEPWLPSVSIQDAIIGPYDLDPAWLAEVLAACDLGQDISTLPEREHSFIGSNGASLSGGQKQRLSLARALYSHKEVLLLDDVLSGLDLSTDRIIAQNLLGPNGFCRRHGLTVLMTALTTKHVKHFDTHYVFGFGGTLHKSQINQSPSPKIEDEPESRPEPVQEKSHDSFPVDDQGSVQPFEKAPAPVQTTTDTGIELYSYFLSKMGWSSISMVFVASATFVFCYKFPDIWLKWWTESKDDSSETMYMTVYILLAAVALVALTSFSWSLKIIAVPRTAARLHLELLATVVSAPYHFLVATGPGSIVNRFSEDLSVIDLQLTLALAKSIDGFFTIIAEASLVAFASPYTFLAFPPLLVVLWILQKIYLRTSRQIRLLEIEARAPLYSHFLEMLSGLVTIRGFEWQRHWVKRQMEVLDRSQRALYMTYCTQRWLNLVLDLIVAGIGVMVMALVTQLPREKTDGGALGVSLTNIVTFSATLTYVIQGWAQLETSMGAVQRVRDFTEQTPSENKFSEGRKPPSGWGSSPATVRFDRVTAAYSNSSSAILKDISFEISPGQKVGICGRTGSGKSTLLLTLLRLTEALEGSITVGNVDILHLQRDSVRQDMTVIPQDPALFPRNLRYNLDPDSSYSDVQIIEALKRVGLSSLQDLDIDMTHSTSASLSRGELQLFALARALLRRNDKASLLVMDEVTSACDTVTEEKIMQIVKEDFTNSTVLAVAHRLETILDFDVVFVMDQGKLKEVGKPMELLKNPKSMFAHLYDS